MQHINLALAFAASALLCACSSTPASAPAPATNKPAEASANMPSIAQVTPQHLLLEKKAGMWTARVKDPSGAESDATYEASIGCGGLWLIGDWHGQFGAATFSGHEVDGFDATRKLYVTTWVDSWTDHPMTLEGAYDVATNTLTQWTEGHDPATGAPIKERHETHFIDGDHFVYTMSGPGPDGTYAPFMTINYTRKK